MKIREIRAAGLRGASPEGGWTEEEMALFAQHEWQAATLGKSILRAETAAIAALAIVVSSLQFSAAR